MRRRFLTVLGVAALSTGLLLGCGSKETEKQTAEETTEGTADQEVEDDEEVVSGFTDGDTESDEEAGPSAASEDEAEGGDSAASEGTGDVTEGETLLLNTDQPLSGTHHAEIEVQDYGTIAIELDADTAPITVTNFVKLAQEDFYDGLTFHRIMDGFMIQGGDPLGNGRGGSDENIKGEFKNNGVENDISHVRGVISMARSSQPDSASSQFFIVQTDSTFLDGDYAAFGKVTEGMEIVDAICKDAKPTDNNGTITAEEQPVITSVTIVD